MASFKQYTASGGASEAFSIPTFSSDEIKVYVDNVLKTAATHYNITSYTANGGTVTWTSGNVPNGVVVRIVRDTTVTTARATYSAGSSIKADDLNDNQTQALRSLEEQDDQLIQTYDVEDAAITTAKIKADNITSALIADDQINSEHYVDGSIDTAHIADAQVTTAKIAADAITAAKIADDVVNSEHIAAGAVDLEHMSANSVDSDQYVDGSIDLAHMSANSVDSDQYVDGSIDTVHIADLNVTTAKIAADAVTNAKIADNSIDSEHYVDGSIDTVHLADNSVTGAKLAAGTIGTTDLADSGVTTAKIAADAVTGAKIADDAIANEHIQDGQVYRVHLVGDAVDSSKLADNAVNSEHYVDGSIDTEHIADANITTAKIADNAVTSAKIAADAIDGTKIADNAIGAEHIAANAVTTSEIADAELTTLAGMQTGTASILAGGTALTATLAEINTVVDGKSVETTISDTDAAYPTSGAVVDYVAAQIAPIGGLEVIATDAAFPNTQPAAGVVISIADAGGLVVNGSGTSTTGRTVGGSTVTINNIASNFNSTTVDNGVAFMVSSTGSGQIYNYHKATLKEADLLSLSGDINDFAERYRVAGSAPSSSLDEGDLWWDTATDKLKVYDGSSWEEVASSGDFYINTISSYSGTGGNSATFNGSAYRFTLSNPGSSAQQHVVSINGVIQKPNSGTSQPSEGFVIDGSSIIFSDAPATGSDYFILTLGTTVSIGTPSDNTVSTAKIQNLAVTGDKIATNLDLADSKKIRFGTGNDLEIYHDGSNSYIANATNNLWITGSGDGANNNILIRPKSTENSIKATGNAGVELYYDNAKKFETNAGGAECHGNLIFDDSYALYLGNSYDLQIYHDGSNSIITAGTTGDLQLTSTNDDVVITGADDVHIQVQGGENGIRVYGDGAVKLYYDNSMKFETTSTGTKFYEDAYFNGANNHAKWDHSENHLIFFDSSKAVFGDGEDLQIYHNGTNSFIANSTGQLQIKGDHIELLGNTAAEYLIRAIKDGAVELYHDNAKKIETASYGAVTTGTHQVTGNFELFDNGQAIFGTGGDLKIYHDGSNSYIDDTGTGSLLIDSDSQVIFRTDTFTVNNAANSENMLVAAVDGAVDLYYDSSKKFETASYGAITTGTHKVQGAEGGSAELWLQADEGDDDADNWLIYHDASDNMLKIASKPGGSYVDNFRIQNDGRVQIPNDTGKYECGSSSDLQIYHDGTNSHVTNNTGKLLLRSDELKLQNGDGTDTYLKGVDDGTVELYHNNSLKFRTYADGAMSYGHIRPDTDDSYDLGISGARWDDVYATNGTIQTSDRNSKKDIVKSDLGLSFINAIEPVSYKFKTGSRTHYGVIAQDLETVLDGKDFAGLTKDTETGNYGIRYTELISPLIKAVQELSAKIETLETKVAALEAK
jgi:hypothetical protein